MASTYTPLGIELQATGENAGTWGTKTNTNLEIIEQIAGGYTTQSIASTPTTLSVSDGSTGATLAHRVIEFTGTIGEATTVTIPLDVQDFYIIKNNSSGAYTVTFKYASGSGSTVQWSATDKGTKIIYATANDGTNPDMVDLFAGLSQLDLVNQNELRFQDATGGQYIGLKAPTTISSAFTLTLPDADATSSGMALTSNASGTLSFSTAGITTGKAIAMAMIFG